VESGTLVRRGPTSGKPALVLGNDIRSDGNVVWRVLGSDPKAPPIVKSDYRASSPTKAYQLLSIH
jgi:hypothetical protein